MKNILCVLIVMILLAGCVGKPSSHQTILFYGNITSIEPLLEYFENGTSIKVDYQRISSTDFLSKLTGEYEIGSLEFDVIQAPITVLEQLAKMGVLSPYVSSSGAYYPDWARRESEGIYKFAIEYVGILYNSDFVNVLELPKNIRDLADPKWKDKIVMPNPSIHPTTISWLVSLKNHDSYFNNNESEWESFLRGLARNNPLFVESFTPTASVIKNGERPIGISMPKYIITNSPSSLRLVEMTTMLGSLRGIGISADAKNLEAAQSFIDFWLSDNAAKFLANEVGEYVLSSGIYPPIDNIEEISVFPIADLSDEETVYWGNVFKSIFNIE